MSNTTGTRSRQEGEVESEATFASLAASCATTGVPHGTWKQMNSAGRGASGIDRGRRQRSLKGLGHTQFKSYYNA